jgi:hypothetical protein
VAEEADLHAFASLDRVLPTAARTVVTLFPKDLSVAARAQPVTCLLETASNG